MKILTKWLRWYVPGIAVDDHRLAEDLTLRGIAVEGVHDLGRSAAGESNGHLFEMDITTNRVDAMNHYGVAREVATIYGLPLMPLEGEVARTGGAKAFPVALEAPEVCGRFTAQVLQRSDDCAFDRRGGGVLRAAGVEGDLECGGCVELCAAGDGASDACV